MQIYLLISENDSMKQGVYVTTAMDRENLAGFTNHLAWLASQAFVDDRYHQYLYSLPETSWSTVQ